MPGTTLASWNISMNTTDPIPCPQGCMVGKAGNKEALLNESRYKSVQEDEKGHGEKMEHNKGVESIGGGVRLQF